MKIIIWDPRKHVTFGVTKSCPGSHTLANNLSCLEFSIYLDSLRTLACANLVLVLLDVLVLLPFDNGEDEALLNADDGEASIILFCPRYPDIMCSFCKIQMGN